MNPIPHDPWTDRLSDYLDGGLSDTERAACDAHVAGCADCARVLEELRAVVARAGSLPTPPVPADLWAGIEARLETPVLRVRPRAALRETWLRRWSLSGFQLAGAAAALVAITAGITWLAVSRGPVSGPVPTATTLVAGQVPAERPGDSAGVEPLARAGTAAVDRIEPESPNPSAAPGTAAALAGLDADWSAPSQPADFGIGRYDAAIAELESTLDAKRSRLHPETIRVVEASLAAVDQAIADARKALEADPASRYLNAHLASTMRRKVDLLRRLNSLARV